jgi:membrane associated rhomboid family serine protease
MLGGMKILVLLLLLAVVASLFSGLYFVANDKGRTDRAVVALSVRVGLSITVFGLLMAAQYFGWLANGRLA